MSKNKSDYKLLLKLLLKHCPSELNSAPELSEKEFDNLIKLLFLNNHTFQLSYRGLTIFSKIFKGHRIDLPEEYILRSKDLITLDRACNFPYYVNVKEQTSTRQRDTPHIILFEQELAMILKLSDGNIDMIIDIPRNKNFQISG